ncbi:MAG TPA: DegT/DnrJ/EryC1/StrS family aminotransferase [Polyangiaceae bacterium]|nr:DegT/DnrJ/EryC1/StrS family aminotransferase [Polyangiaceae bacterium]
MRAELEAAAARVLRSGRSILGDEVVRFEADFARVVGAKFAVGVSNGTDALVAALLAVGVGPGDEVLVGAFGFVAAPEAVVRVGAKPVFVDVEPATLGLDPDKLRAADADSVRAVISVDLFGLVHDATTLRSAIPDVAVVEDAAQAFGSTFGGRSAGTLGTIGTFSFFPSKALGAAGDGGACVTDDARLAERMRSIRSHGIGKEHAWREAGGNYRLDAIQAALLGVKLTRIEARLARRRAIGARLAEAIRRTGATPLVGVASCRPVFAPLAIRVAADKRDAFVARLRASGVDARVHYPETLAQSRPFEAFAAGRSFPEAERATRELVSLPCHPELTDAEIDELVAALTRAL